jgi:hypothetical protein
MNCFAEMAVSDQRELRMEGRNCFLCRGPIQKVENKTSIGSLSVDIDCSNAIKGLKDIQRESKKATAALKELEEQKENKYLVIELDELGNVPRVVYKGKEITKKEFVNFQWTSKSNVPGNTDIIVDYFGDSFERESIREGVSS